jgi:hypothetical protein
MARAPRAVIWGRAPLTRSRVCRHSPKVIGLVARRAFPCSTCGVALSRRLRRRSLRGVVDRTVAQLRHRLLQVGTAVAVGGDAIGHDEAL